MKKVLISLGVITAVLLVLGYVYREALFLGLMGAQIAPEKNFDEMIAPKAPDYRSDEVWAALPSINDPSDQMPQGVSKTETGVAVFFVHPTSYFGKTWNQPLDHTDANWVVDERILRHQASVFNGCCDIYAPRYRQATFFSFMDQSGDGEKALALAYEDVVRAFKDFLRRLEADQPFVIAGHSQGTRHATQLVREHVTGTELQDRLVAAYLVGFSVTYPQLAELPACDSASETGCAVGWNVMDGDSGGAFGGEGVICTNPLTWRDRGSYAKHELNMGAIGFETYGQALEGENVSAMNVEQGVADAKCIDDGQLAVMDLRSESFPQRMMGASMHVYDYSLFHMNVRENVATRIAAYLAGAR